MRLTGQCKWNAETLTLEKFQIEHVEEFKNHNPNVALQELSKIVDTVHS